MQDCGWGWGWHERECCGECGALIQGAVLCPVLGAPRTVPAVTKTTAAEYESRKMPVVALALYPGTVDTDLTRPYQKYIPQDKIFTTEFAVSRLLDIIEGSRRGNGRFIAWDGKEVPW